MAHPSSRTAPLSPARPPTLATNDHFFLDNEKNVDLRRSSALNFTILSHW
jgi:hypothetical protein